MQGQVALVTGASRGIGAAIAQRLGQAGASVIINYKSNEAQARAVQEKIGDHARIFQTDVADPHAVKRMFEMVRSDYQRLDVLVSNAAISGPVKLTDVLSLEEWHDVINTNFYGALHVTREAIPLMQQGRIVYISAALPERPAARLAPYGVSKGAVNALAKSIAAEYGDRITANVVIPGPVSTDMGRKGAENYELDAGLLKDHFMSPKMITVEHVADVVHMLCSGPRITAQEIYADNGWQRKYIAPRKRA